MDWLVKCLAHRRDKIGRAYFEKLLPLDGFEVREDRLAFDDLAVRYDFNGPRSYPVAWMQFDNYARRTTGLPDRTTPELPPEPANARPGEYFAAAIRGSDPKKTVTASLRRTASGVEVAGIDRRWR